MAAAGDGVRPLAPGVDLVPGRFVQGEQPDGNSVVFHAPEGLVIVDTGRHPEHTRELIELATTAGVAPKAIVNTHWHLDHTGGNLLLRAHFPAVRVYASDAMAGARKGFLATYRAQLAVALEHNKSRPDEAAKIEAEMALIDAGDRLAPDELVTATGERTLAGRKLVVGLETHAATAGDVWVLDPASGILAAGDLVTLPVPFLDTACPRGWQAALDHLARLDFATLVPGHGEPLSRAGLDAYRTAFGDLLACAASKHGVDDCSSQWFATIGDLARGSDPTFARGALRYYVEKVLRGDGKSIAAACAP